MSADCQMLKVRCLLFQLSERSLINLFASQANRSFLFFPLGGPGGRLAVHPFSATGRLPTHIPAVVCGATIVDFEISPFDQRQVFVASDDSKIRVFELPEGGIEEDTGDANWVLGGKQISFSLL